ncbi:MAG: class I SAM-dependent methyltransferase [Planctomycetota bacterium]
MIKSLYCVYCTLGRWFLHPMLLLEWKRSHLKQINERAAEYGFALKWLLKNCPVEVLDVGAGRTSWPHLMANCGFRVTAIDKIKDYWKSGFFNRHYYIINSDITRLNINKQFDFITCISVIEHIPNHKDAFDGMLGLLKPGGHLVLTFPYNEKQYIDNVYKLPDVGYGRDYPFICQVLSRRQIDEWLADNPAKIIDQEYYEIFSGDLWAFGERIRPPKKVEKERKCHLTCLVIQKTNESKI